MKGVKMARGLAELMGRGGCRHNKGKQDNRKNLISPSSLPFSLSLLTISICLHFLLKANSALPGLRWMAALELRFNQ